MSQLPEGWAEAPAHVVCTLVQSGGTPKNKPFTATGDVPFLKVYNIQNQHVAFEYKPQFISRSIHDGELRKSQVLPGDVLMNIVGPPLGKVAVVPNTFPMWNINQAIVTFRPGPAVLKEYLYHFLCEGSAISAIEHEYRGSAGQTNISLSQARNFGIAIPPLSEQKRIVAKVEALLAEVDAARERLEKVPAILKRFRQSVLATAYSGRLTEDWRGRVQENSVLDVIAQAKTQRKRFWLSESPSRKESKYQEPACAEGTEEFPEGWQVATGAQLFLWGSGEFLPKAKMKEGLIPVFGGNGISGKHNVALVHEPTLVVGRVGAQCGNVHITPGPAWVTDNAIYARWIAPHTSLDFVRMVFSARNLNANAGGTGQPFVNQELLDSVTIPLPPANEQREIVNRVRGLYALSAAIEGHLANGKGRANQLVEAIFAKAFRGELVPTEAELARAEGREYESASQLLARVQTEREAREPVTPAKKRNAKEATSGAVKRAKRRAATG